MLRWQRISEHSAILYSEDKPYGSMIITDLGSLIWTFTGAGTYETQPGWAMVETLDRITGTTWGDEKKATGFGGFYLCETCQATHTNGTNCPNEKPASDDRKYVYIDNGGYHYLARRTFFADYIATKYYDTLRDELAEAKREKVCEWVEVADTLPEESVSVIAWAKEWSHPMCGYFNSGLFHLHPKAAYQFAQPTHWRQLPDTPYCGGKIEVVESE